MPEQINHMSVGEKFQQWPLGEVNCSHAKACLDHITQPAAGGALRQRQCKYLAYISKYKRVLPVFYPYIQQRFIIM